MTNGRFDHIDDGPFMGAMREVWGWLRARPRLLWGGIAGLVALIALAGSYYQVEPDEVGLVTRFGRFVRSTGPGPHAKVPFGIERVQKVPVERQLKQEFGFRTVAPTSRATFARTKRRPPSR